MSYRLLLWLGIAAVVAGIAMMIWIMPLRVAH
jgi:hypothetical protein